MKKTNKKFTLIELIIVIVVIGILAGMALPKFIGVRRDAQVAAMQRDLDTIEKAVIQYVTNTDDGSYPFKNETRAFNPVTNLPDELIDSLESVGDDGSEVYTLDMEKLEPYISKLKYKDDTYLYSLKSEMAVSLEGKIDGKGNVHYIINDTSNNGTNSPNDPTNPPTEEDSNTNQKKWSKVFGGNSQDFLNAIVETKDGGSIAVGYTQSKEGPLNGVKGSLCSLIVKYDANGEVEWYKTYGGSGQDYLRSIQQTSDGGYIAVGTTDSQDGDFIKQKKYSDALMVKLSSTGEIEWYKTYGGDDSDDLKLVQQTKDGGFIAVGETLSKLDSDFTPSKGSKDFLIIKTNVNGEIEWSKTYGGPGSDNLTSIDQTSDGGYIIGGRIGSKEGDFSPSKGSYDAFVGKLSSTGEIEWHKVLGGTSSETIYAVKETKDKGFIAVGETSSTDGDFTPSKGSSDALIIKFDSKGEITWSKTYGGVNADTLFAIDETTNGEFVVGGSSGGSGDFDVSNGKTDCLILKLNSNGEMISHKIFGGTGAENVYSIIQTKDGGYMIAGSTESIEGPFDTSYGYHDTLVVKLNNNFEFK